jgi:alkanesulfonate monooxygenase SsuD/methylene tetrahydromethanopterin reductase-like flavin-dependent oxidoreductase (luciferase family)
LAKDLKLGLQLGYWGAGPPADAPEKVAEAERLGYDSIWTAEAYGSDALTPLAWLGASTSRVRLGTAIVQLSARTPTATAMAALTLDHLSGGRVVLGLGVSGPQVVEGWYGATFPKPLARTREYVDIVRQVLGRAGPVVSAGPHYPLPRTGPDTTGLGKPLKPIVHPLRADVPIILGAEGAKNIYRAALAEGFARLGARRSPEEFEIVCSAAIVIDDDVERAADLLRPMLALYIGGMGAREMNFHFDVFARMGFADAARRIQDLYLDDRKDEAAAAVPTELIDATSLVGPVEKIRDGLDKWRESPVTTLLVGGGIDAVRTMAELVL